MGADSALYLESAKNSIFDGSLWSADVPAGYPLLIKLVGAHWRALIAAQTAISTAAWVYLAFGVRQLFEVTYLRLIAFGLILSTGLAATFQVWDAAIGTESLSLAATAVAIGASCFMLHGVAPKRRRHAAAGLVGAVVAALTRDANAVVLLAIALVVLLVMVRRRNWRTTMVALGVGVVAMSCIGLSTQGRRWYWQTVDLVAIRMVGDADARQFMIDRGLVYDGAVESLHRDYGGNVIRLLQSDADLDRYQEWISTSGRSAYYAFLLRHPAWVALKPLEARDEVIRPGLGGEGSKYAFDIELDKPTRAVGALAFAEVALLRWFVMFATAVGALTLLFSRGARRSTALRIGAGLIVVATGHFWVVFHGDALEVARHAMGATMQLQIASILVLCGVLNLALERRRLTGRGGPVGTEVL